MTHSLQTLIPKLANLRVLIVGDIVLDEYLTGRAARMSREAPIPVLEFESRRLLPGGAANPAANIVALGSEAVQIGLVGDDDSAQQLRETLAERGINTSGLVVDSQRPTTVKTRIMAQMGLRFPQQVARMDRLSRDPVSGDVEAQIVEIVSTNLSGTDAVLFSDYRGGLITPTLARAIRQQVGSLLVTADAQGELGKYQGFGLVKCNADEASEHLGRALHSDDDFAVAAAELRAVLDLSVAMVITRGGDGATLADSTGETVHCPAPSVTDVFDTVGAGDTSIAVMTVALAAGADAVQAVTLANYASGLVVRRVGNYTPNSEELTRAVAMWG